MERVARQKTCPECGSTKLVRDYERAELVCAECGFVIHDKIMDMGPEWRAFDQEQRDRRGRVGAPMTLSVDYSEPIIVEKNGDIEVLPIGKFVDTLIRTSSEVKKEGIVEWANVEKLGYRVVAFDKNYKIDFRPMTHVYRHELYENIYQVELEGERKILVTGAHSLYTVNEDFEVVHVKVEELKQGDFIVAPKWIPTIEKQVREINLIEEFLKLPSQEIEDLYLRHVNKEVFDELKGNGVPANLLKSWRSYRILPLSLADKFDGNIGSNITISVHGGKSEIPSKIEVDERLCKLLGYYVSEGWVSPDKSAVGFSFGAHEENYVKEVQELLRSLFRLEPTTRFANQIHSSLQVCVFNKALVKFLTHVLKAGKNSREKRVPPILFSLPAELKVAFLQAYVCGDGCMYTKDEKKPYWRPVTQLSTISTNKALSIDVLTLYSQLGIYAGYHEQEIPGHEIRPTGQFVNEYSSTGTRLTNPDSIAALGFFRELPRRKRKGAIENFIPAPIKYRKIWKCRKRIRINRELAIKIAKKFNDQKLLKLANAPFVFLRVKEVKKVAPTSEYAYDISVPGCENFLIAGKCFASNTIHDKGLSTMIDWRDRDSHGKDLTPKRRAQIYRLRKWQRRIRVSDATERNLAFALSEIDRMASHLALPRNVREAASLIYRKAVEERLIRGRSIEGVAAAALYAACRECKVPRTLDEIADVSRVGKKEIGRSYRFIARELLIHLRPTSPVDYIPRFGSELGLSGEVQSKAIELLKEATKKGLTSGRGPTGVAAAAIYIASVLCGERRTQRDVADVARVTEVTVRNRYKELCEKLGLDVEL